MVSSVDAKGVKVTYITAVCWEWMGSFLKGDQEGLTMADFPITDPTAVC